MKKFMLLGLAISLILACAVSYFASSSPDGLERVAEDQGFLSAGEGKEIFKAPLPDYSAGFIKNRFISNGVSGFIGTLIVFGIAMGAGLLLRRKR